MTRRDCKTAALWLAALESGELDEASRIRLHDHLERCPACRAQAQRVGAIAAHLRQQQPRLGESRRKAIWTQLQERQQLGEQAHRPPARGRALALAAVAAIVLLGLGAALTLLRGEQRNDELAGQASSPAQETRPTTPPPDRPAPGEPAWQLQTGVLRDPQLRQASGAISSSAPLKVASEQDALLTRAGTRVMASPETTLVLSSGDLIKLIQGRLLVRSQPRSDQQGVRVQVATLVVKPIGTAFAVSYDGRQPPRVEVFEGRVEVAAAKEAVQLIAGSQLVWGQEPQPLPDSRASEVDPADSENGRPRRRQHPARAKKSAHPESSPEALTMADQLRQIERLLTRGETRLARQRARALIAHKRGGAQLPALLTLIAESLLKEGAYQAARDAYLRVYRTSPQSTYGALALFGAGTLELEQLDSPARASEHLSQYLARFPRGHQREGAHYLLVRALRELGRDGEADAVVRRYRAAFPEGQYSDRMSLSSEDQPSP